MDSHEFDHVFSFNGFLGFTKFSVAALLSSADVGVWVVCLMVSDWNRFYDNFRIGYWPQYYKCIFFHNRINLFQHQCYSLLKNKQQVCREPLQRSLRLYTVLWKITFSERGGIFTHIIVSVH